MKKTLFLLALILTSPALMAKAKYEHKSVEFDPAVFEQQRRQLVDEIKTGQAYAEISDYDRTAVISALEELGAMLKDIQSINDLDDRQKVEVFNRQELVNTLLTQAAEDSRVICKREAATGSHRTTTRCRTVAETRREREQSVQGLRANGYNRILLTEPSG